MSLDRVFKNQSSTQDWISEKLSLEAHMVHVNKVSVVDGKVKAEGRMLLQGVKSVRFDFEIEL